MLRKTLFFLVLLIPSTVALALDGGFSGHIGAGVAVVNRSDNLWGGGSARISSLSEKARLTTKVYPVPLVDVAYRKGSNEIYLGRSPEEMAGVSVGLKHRDGDGVVDISWFYSFFSTEWEDPYQLGVERQETDVDRYGMRLSWDSIMGSSFGLSYRAMTKKVEHDRRGELNPELRRDGTIHILKGSWRPQVSRGFFMGPFVTYERGVMDGDAESYDGLGGGVEGSYRRESLLLYVRGTGEWTEYDDSNPIFGRKRRQSELNFTTTATYYSPFNVKDYFVSAGIVHRTRAANPDFFDANSTLFFATIGYSF